MKSYQTLALYSESKGIEAVLQVGVRQPQIFCMTWL